MEGVDYAWERPNLDQLWAAGKRFACRYLAYLPNGKVLSAAELRSLQTRGFGVVLNWEQSAGDMLKGRATGEAHAREALRQANGLGAPASVPIYFSCDVDTTSNSQRLAAAAYLDGCAAVLGRARVGVYGEFEVIEFMLAGGKASWGWQTYAWSGGKVSALAHVMQYRNGVTLAGATLDLDRSLKDNFGAWWKDQAPQPQPTGGPQMMRIGVKGKPDIYLTNGAGKTHIQPGLNSALEKAGVPVVWVDSQADLDQATGFSVPDPDLTRMLKNLDRWLTAILNWTDEVTGINGAEEFPNHVKDLAVGGLDLLVLQQQVRTALEETLSKVKTTGTLTVDGA